MSDSHHRRSIRKSGYDYTSCGAYFITICTDQRRELFGKIQDGKTIQSIAGSIVQKCWDKIPDHFQHVGLDEFVIMPDHIHGIIWIIDNPNGRGRNRRGKACLAPTLPTIAPTLPTIAPTLPTIAPTLPIARFGKPSKGSIGTIIGSFKSAVTNAIHHMDPRIRHIWQRNYFERIIRKDTELNVLRQYIRNNPQKHK